MGNIWPGHQLYRNRSRTTWHVFPFFEPCFRWRKKNFYIIYTNGDGFDTHLYHHSRLYIVQYNKCFIAHPRRDNWNIYFTLTCAVVIEKPNREKAALLLYNCSLIKFESPIQNARWPITSAESSRRKYLSSSYPSKANWLTPTPKSLCRVSWNKYRPLKKKHVNKTTTLRPRGCWSLLQTKWSSSMHFTPIWPHHYHRIDMYTHFPPPMKRCSSWRPSRRLSGVRRIESSLSHTIRMDGYG